MKHTLGVSAGFHDAALTLLDQHGKIVFAGHSERYSKKKNDADISTAMLDKIDMMSLYLLFRLSSNLDMSFIVDLNEFEMTVDFISMLL
jgi:predicted NodU family carbamoyl transferase